MPGRVRVARGHGAPAAAADGRALRRFATVDARERDDRQPRRARDPPDGTDVRRGRGRRRAVGREAVRAVEPADHRRGRRNTAERAHRGIVADVTAGPERHPHDRLHPVATSRGAAGRVRASRRGRRAEACADQVVPSGLPGGGSPEARAGAGQRRAARDRVDERPRARHRHRLARRRGVDRLPGHARLHVAAGRPRRAPGRGLARDAGGPRRSARPVPRASSRGPVRQAARGGGDRPDEPLRPGTAPALRGARAAAPRGRARVLRGRARRQAGGRSDGRTRRTGAAQGDAGTIEGGSPRTARSTSAPGPGTSTRSSSARRASCWARPTSIARTRPCTPAPCICTRAISTWSTSWTWCRASPSCTMPTPTTTRSRATSPTSRWSTSARRAGPATSMRSSAPCASRTRS